MASKRPTARELSAAVSRGREAFRRQWNKPRPLAPNSSPIRVAEMRGWLLEASRVYGGDWRRDIPAMPASREEVEARRR